MSQTAPASEPSTATPPPAAGPAQHAAVQHGLAAYHRTFTSIDGSRVRAHEAASDAYKAALPFLSSRASIRDFIACVAHGMALKVFWNDEGPKMIAAAKAAIAALPREIAPIHPHAVNQGGRPPKPNRDPLP
jgi:hypothetical protein